MSGPQPKRAAAGSQLRGATRGRCDAQLAVERHDDVRMARVPMLAESGAHGGERLWGRHWPATAEVVGQHAGAATASKVV